MKEFLRFLVCCLVVLGVFYSCEKDSELYSPKDQNAISNDYAVQAEDLLAQLTPEELELLSQEDIAAFKNGPAHKDMELTMRSAFQIKRQWHPVLAVFYCKTEEGVVDGTGPWYTSGGNASLMIEQDMDAQGKLLSGYLSITDRNDYTLQMMFTAAQPSIQENGVMRQYMRATGMSGTGYFIQPSGGLDMNILMRPNRPYPVVVIARGWLWYGLNVPPVPRHFEPYFSTDFLMAHYACLENTPGAKAMYLKTQNEFWVYPTAAPMTNAAPGIGEGIWDGKEITFVVDQNFVGDMTNDPEHVLGKGRYRIYLAPKADYMNAEYVDACFTHTLTPTGGYWPFELKGGTESFINYTGEGAGVWIGQSALNYGVVPPEGTFPPDFIDDGFRCQAYGNTDCAGLCLDQGEPLQTVVYMIACYYEKSTNKCFKATSVTGTAQLDTPVVITLPGGEVFEGFGSRPVNMTLGGYSGTWQFVVLREELTATGAEYMVLHYFTDGAGNGFWTSGYTVATAEGPGTMSFIDRHILVGGTGDFKCARGAFRTQGIMFLNQFTLDYSLTGNLCMGCE